MNEIHKLKEDKVGIMGFSAGGHLTAATAPHFTMPANPRTSGKVSIRPGFVAFISRKGPWLWAI